MQVLTVLHVIISIALIVVILLQSGKSAGLSGVVDGGASQFFGKANNLDEKLSKLTGILGILFGITSVVIALL